VFKKEAYIVESVKTCLLGRKDIDSILFLYISNVTIQLGIFLFGGIGL
jgi:hypothetical protein